jgi:hypothetical protein
MTKSDVFRRSSQVSEASPGKPRRAESAAARGKLFPTLNQSLTNQS